MRVGGRVTPVPDEEADPFFATRPREANLAAGIAPQDEVIAGPEVLEKRLRQLLTASEGLAVGRPTGWGGYVVAPDEIEFWQGRPDHLHDRLRYHRPSGGAATTPVDVGPSGPEFVRRFEGRVGRSPDYLAAQAAAAGYLAAEAAARGYGADDVRGWQADTLLGPFRLDSSWRQAG